MNTVRGTKYKGLNRLKDALISNACQNQTESFTRTYAFLPEEHRKHFKDRLMDLAMKNISKDIVEFLIKEGAICNYMSCLHECHYRKMYDVYLFITEMIDKHGSFTKNTTHFHKSMIVKRLLDPEKVINNKDRLSCAIDLMRDGKISIQDVKQCLDEYKDSKHVSELIMINREISLSNLGI